MKRVTNILIIASILVFFSSCKTSNDFLDRGYDQLSYNAGNPLITLLEDDIENSNSNSFTEIQIAANYSKFVVNKTKLSDFNKYYKLPYSTRILCIEETYPITDRGIDSLHTFVARGGTIFLTKSNFDERMAFLMGLSPSYRMVGDIAASGIKFNESNFPLVESLSINGDNKHLGISRENFSDNVKVVATAKNNDEFPLIIINQVGHGKVVLFNSYLDFDKTKRGLAFAQLLIGLEGIPYPVANVANIHLDDFPAPVYDIYKEPVKTQMGLNMSDFVTDVWWPDMKSLAKKHNLKYTVYPAFDYNHTIIPPFAFQEWESKRFIKNNYEQEIPSWLGRDVIATGHELGFHGYNHVSLTKEEWKEPDYIVEALQTVTKKWKISNFKNLPTSYVPPSNIIDSLGLSKLAEGMPSLKYIQSTYLGYLDEGGNREFSPDPFNPYFFDVPRISSGYFLTEDVKFNISSLFLITGIWTHFLHPDDVFQIPDPSNLNTAGGYSYRNKYELPWRIYKGKKGLLETFDEELNVFKKHYPLTRFITATDAADLIVKWRYAQYQHINEDGLYVVLTEDISEKDNFENYWFTYISKENDAFFERNLKNDEITFNKTKFLDGYLYQIKTEESFISWVDLKYKNEGTKNAKSNIVLNNRNKFQNLQNALLPFLLKFEKLENLGKFDQAATLFENQIEKLKTLPRKEWMLYAKILSWNNSPERFWMFLEEKYKEEPSKNLANIALKVKNKYGVPSDAITEKWLSNAISWNLGGLSLLREYVAYYKNENNHERIKNIMQQIFDITNSDTDKYDLIKYLIENNDNEADALLNDINPCENKFQNLAYEITWYYANNFNYDAAYQWAKCVSEIDKETKEEWFVKTENFEELKTTDKYTYFSILLNNDEQRAFEELKLEQICENELRPVADKIAMLFGDVEDYERAVEWSYCANDIPVTRLMTWNYELKNYDRVKKIYHIHMINNPEANDVTVHMANLYLYMDDLESMAKIVSKLPSNNDFVQLRGVLNKNVKYSNLTIKSKLVENYNTLLSAKTKRDIKEEQRLQESNDVFSSGSSMNDRFDPTQLEFLAGYSIKGKKQSTHSVAGVRGFAFPINFIEDEEDNQERNLFGFEYKFTKQLNTRNTLVLSARIERDNIENIFFHTGIAWQLAKEKSFLATELNHRPVQTGPGYVRNIYQTSFAMYAEPILKSFFKPVLTLEGNYFSDDNFDTTFNTRIEARVIKGKNLEIAPLIESSYSLATEDRREGFPYWIADKRLIAGGGLALRIGKQEQRFFLDTSASIFYENQDQPTFERYLANLNMKIRKYFIVSAGAEFYTIESFFSNAFNLGLRYNL